MVHIGWNDLRRLSKEFSDNATVKARLMEAWRQGATCDSPNALCGRAVLQADIKTCIAELIRCHPDDWQEGVPERLVEWFREEPESSFILSQGGKRKKVNFVMIPYPLVDEGWLTKDKKNPGETITAEEFLVLLVFARFAYFGSGVNEHGCRYGETFVSNRTVAEILGMSRKSVDRLAASLNKKGHLVTVSQVFDGRQNKCVRLVTFMVAQWREDDGGQNDPYPQI